MLNFDMVGRLDTNSMILRIIRNDNYSEIDSLLFKVKPEKLNLRITSENKDFTDASAFYSLGISSLSFTTGSHDDYHKTSDTAEKINYEGIKIILNFAETLLFNLQEHEKNGKK